MTVPSDVAPFACFEFDILERLDFADAATDLILAVSLSFSFVLNQGDDAFGEPRALTTSDGCVGIDDSSEGVDEFVVPDDGDNKSGVEVMGLSDRAIICGVELGLADLL